MNQFLKFLFLSLYVCSAATLNIPPEIVEINDIDTRGPIDEALYNLFDNLRYSLRCGFPEQGIPSLAPFVIDSAEVSERGLLYDIQGNVRNFSVEGLDGYSVDIATLSILTLRVSVGFTFPKVGLSSLYDLNALLLRFLPIYGHGRIVLDVNDFTIRGNGRLSLSLLSRRLNLTTLDIAVGMGSIHSDSTGIYDSRIVSTLFNIAFEKMLEDIFTNNKANIEKALEDLIIPIANQYLNELTLEELLNLIIGGSNEPPQFDSDTGELICHAEESTTSELLPTTDDENSLNPETTLADQTTKDDDEFKSTANTIDPPDDSNSSNFLFNKFQVMILTVFSTFCLRTS